MFDIRWENKKLKDGQYVNYDPKLKGKEIKAQFCLEIVGTYVDEEGKEKTETVYSNWVNTKLTVGKTSEIDIRELEYENGIDVTKYKSFVTKSLVWPVHPYTGNYRWNLTDGSYDADNEHPNRHFTEINQSMSTRVEYEQEDESIILDEDKDNINLKYNIKKKGSDELFRNKKRGNVVVVEEEKFTTKEREEWDKWLSTNRPKADDDSMNMAIRSAYLESFNRYVNREGREFELVVDFKGKDNKDTERLNKYYTLKIKGNDLDGWTVTLGSKLKAKEIHNDKVTKFETEYIDDPNLDAGEEIETQAGQNGILRDTLKLIYLPGQGANPDEIVKKIDISKNVEIQKLIKRIVRRGFKKPSNPSDPTVTPGDDTLPTDPQIDLPSDEDDEEYGKLIQDLIDEINKELEKETTEEIPTDLEKPGLEEENKKETEKENKTETTKPKKEEKAKEKAADPVKTKPADQKANKGKSPKTGVTGSAAVAALGLSSLFASLGLRKKND
mgnify:CR=1 FL=1